MQSEEYIIEKLTSVSTIVLRSTKISENPRDSTNDFSFLLVDKIDSHISKYNVQLIPQHGQNLQKNYPLTKNEDKDEIGEEETTDTFYQEDSSSDSNLDETLDDCFDIYEYTDSDQQEFPKIPDFEGVLYDWLGNYKNVTPDVKSDISTCKSPQTSTKKSSSSNVSVDDMHRLFFGPFTM